MKEWIHNNFGISAQSVTPIADGVVNQNFVVADETGECYIVKVYTEKTVDHVAYEVAILSRLAAVNFSAPKLLGSSSIVTYEGKPSVCYKLIDGEMCTTPTNEQLHAIGVNMAIMHQALQSCELPFEKPTWDEKDLQNLVVVQGNDFIDRVGGGAEEILAFSKEHIIGSAPDGLPVAITHQDLKPENIIVQGEAVVGFIDFDNAYRGIRLHDITTSAIWMCWEGEHLATERLQALLQGYESVSLLTAEEKEYLPEALAFRLAREVFIGPYAATGNYPITVERSKHFMKLHTVYSQNGIDRIRNEFSYE